MASTPRPRTTSPWPSAPSARRAGKGPGNALTGAPPRIILASASPRRAALLRQIGLTFEVRPLPDDAHPETAPPALPAGMPPLAGAHRLARQLAASKAAAVADAEPDAVVIGADTIVVTEQGILDKPLDAADAARMLRLLSGRSHHVVTGVAVIRRRPPVSLVESSETAVWFRPLAEDEIARYIASGEPFDKAGGYGIQGRAGAFVERIEGDYFTVVGLPLALVAALLAQAGVAVP